MINPVVDPVPRTNHRVITTVLYAQLIIEVADSASTLQLIEEAIRPTPPRGTANAMTASHPGKRIFYGPWRSAAVYRYAPVIWPNC